MTSGRSYRALQRLEEPGSSPALLASAAGAEILGGFGPAPPRPAVPALIRGLDDLDASVRLAAAHALGLDLVPAGHLRCGLPALAAREADPDEQVRQSAKAASHAIRGDPADWVMTRDRGVSAWRMRYHPEPTVQSVWLVNV